MSRALPKRRFASVCVPEARREEVRFFAVAAALLGIALKPVNDFVEYQRVVSGKPVTDCAWFLEEHDACKKHRTAELWNWWNDPDWLAANPNHPIAKAREFYNELKRAEAHEKESLILVTIIRGNRFVNIPKNTGITEERKKHLLEMLDK